MSQFAAALGAAVTTVGVGAVVMGRSWPIPTGRHRATRPVEALAAIEAYRSAEDRPTTTREEAPSA